MHIIVREWNELLFPSAPSYACLFCVLNFKTMALSAVLLCELFYYSSEFCNYQKIWVCFDVLFLK